MLEEVLRYINNRFERAQVEGEFVIDNGSLRKSQAKDGQYFWIEGSIFNDGLHQHPAYDLVDETFYGKVALLAVPQAVVDIANEISDWVESNSDVLDSPLQSESFGGYSYTKASGNTGASSESGSAPVWQSKFGYKLRHWRKLNADWS